MSNNVRTNLLNINIWAAIPTSAFFFFFTSTVFTGMIQPWIYSQLIKPTPEFYPWYKRYIRRGVKQVKIYHNFTLGKCLEETFVKDYSSFHLYLPYSRPSLWILICSKISKEKNHTICPSARALFCLASHFRCRNSSTCLALSTASCPLCLINVDKQQSQNSEH